MRFGFRYWAIGWAWGRYGCFEMYFGFLLMGLYATRLRIGVWLCVLCSGSNELGCGVLVICISKDPLGRGAGPLASLVKNYWR